MSCSLNKTNKAAFASEESKQIEVGILHFGTKLVKNGQAIRIGLAKFHQSVV